MRYRTPQARINAENKAFAEFRDCFARYFDMGAIYLDGDTIVGRNPADLFAGEVALGSRNDPKGLDSLTLYLAANPDPVSWV